MTNPNHGLGDLIESTRKDAEAQQALLDAQLSKAARPPRGKQIFTGVLLLVFAAVLFYQYPRFSQPYTWPDPTTSTAAAEADLVEVISAIEAYRIAQGKYPEVLSQVVLPQELAARVKGTVLNYRPSERSYTLDWTLPHWTATYDSRTEKLSVAPLAKP